MESEMLRSLIDAEQLYQNARAVTFHFLQKVKL